MRSPFRFLAAVLAGLFTLAACACKRQAPQPPPLRVVFGSEVLSLDPNEIFEIVTDSYAMNVFEPLLRFDWKASYVPVLATHWTNRDWKTCTFTIRPGVFFHDGSPLMASDVVFSIRRLMESKTSEIRPYLHSIESVRATGPLEVEVVSSKPAAVLSTLSLVYILPAKPLAEQGPDAFFKKPLGTGPYILESSDSGKSMHLRRNPGYWGPVPFFPSAEFLFLPGDDEAWAATTNHPASIFVGPGVESWLKKKSNPGLKLSAHPGLTVQFLTVNAKPGRPLSDVRLRQALRLAVDIPGLIRTHSMGSAVPASQFVTPAIAGYNPNLNPVERDTASARKLISKAGYVNGLELEFAVVEAQIPHASEIKKQLAEAGIRIRLKVVSQAEQYEAIKACHSDLSLSGWICSTGDATEVLDGLFSKEAAGKFSCGYESPRLSDLADRIARTLDPETRQTLLQEAMEILHTDVPWIPLYIPEERYATSSAILWEPRPDSEVYIPAVRLQGF